VSVIFIVLPLALAIVAAAVVAYVWAARAGQFDDLDTPALRMLHDDAGRPRAVPFAPPGGGGARRDADAPPG
jgi:cbb3-type cytochrome oxidase maturation protein